MGRIIGPTSCLGGIIGPTSGWIIDPTMSDEAWPAWVNKISVLIRYFSFPFNVTGLKETKIHIHIVLEVKLNYFKAELHGFCGIIWLSRPCLVGKIWIFVTSVNYSGSQTYCRSTKDQQHYGLKLYKYETM